MMYIVQANTYILQYNIEYIMYIVKPLNVFYNTEYIMYIVKPLNLFYNTEYIMYVV